MNSGEITSQENREEGYCFFISYVVRAGRKHINVGNASFRVKSSFFSLREVENNLLEHLPKGSEITILNFKRMTKDEYDIFNS